MIKKTAFPVLLFALTIIVYFGLPASFGEPQRRMSAFFLLIAVLWATEYIPLYATSFTAIIGSIFLLARPGGIMNADVNAYQEFLVPFSSPIIMLFLGGFVIGEALRKYSIDRILTGRMLTLLGSKPVHVMSGLMFMTAFLSMWMSNTATTAMMLAVIKPILESLDKRDRFRSGMVLAVAFGANIGGIGTPIGTPPNAIAMGILESEGIHISFISWMVIGVPLAFILICITIAVLRLLFPPDAERIELPDTEVPALSTEGKFVSLIVLGTIFLWLTSWWHGMPEAVVSLCAVTLLVGSRLIHQTDLRNIRWDILILMWGGLSLAEAVNKSGLTGLIISMPWFSGSGWVVFISLCLCAAGFSTVMSNTVAATLILPIAVSLHGVSPVSAGVGVALSCSLAMVLPVSTPPNTIAFSTEAVSAKQMGVAGLITSFICLSLMLAGSYHIIPAVLR